GQTRLAQYYEHFTIHERHALEGEIQRKCFARTDQQNELAILEFIHIYVETMDRHYRNVMHFMLEEMVMNGCIFETNYDGPSTSGHVPVYSPPRSSSPIEEPPYVMDTVSTLVSEDPRSTSAS
ncbi:AP-4 complex subunit sigma, partial [Ananas comosus]